MKRIFSIALGAGIISLSLLFAPMSFAADAAKEPAKAAAQKPCEPKPVKKVHHRGHKKHHAKKVAAVKKEAGATEKK